MLEAFCIPAAVNRTPVSTTAPCSTASVYRGLLTDAEQLRCATNALASRIKPHLLRLNKNVMIEILGGFKPRLTDTLGGVAKFYE